MNFVTFIFCLLNLICEELIIMSIADETDEKLIPLAKAGEGYERKGAGKG